MNRELIINSSPNEVEIALLEENQLVELHKDKTNSNFSVGDIYLGRVRKIMPGLNAAFVDVGYERDAFLHYLDLGPQILTYNKYIRTLLNGKADDDIYKSIKMENDIQKSGKINSVIKPNQNVLIQIAKEPISSKGPRISSEISFAGRYMVLLPFSNKVSISQKIKSAEERKRLKRLLTSIKPPNFGVIVRTMAEDRKVAELDIDLRGLVKKWETVQKKITNRVKAPMKIVSELDRTSTILRDLLNESFNSIKVSEPAIAEEIKGFIEKIAPGKSGIVNVVKGGKSIFDQTGVEKQIKASFGKIVTIKSGIYLIIEHTEALHVIDVNSGHRVNKDKSQEENALQTNLESATEIARQLRLRDMGGIIVVDFIDMAQAANRRALFAHMKEEMSKDRARHTILPPSKFGLVQITRQRVRPEMNVETQEQCPVCNGTGEVTPSVLLIDEIENNMSYLFNEQNEKKLQLIVHPFVYAFIRSEFRHIQRKWYKDFGKWISVEKDSSYHIMEYHIFNSNEEEIKL
ncbi:MAG: Rne/Rng family ribonuclease [Bacteroidales bacterium]|nr:Rne/Rng family ribonuclease [Bacteroidales bacterium]